MSRSKRILFVAGEVTPFAETSSLADLVRTLPEQLQNAGDFEARVMMPCYEAIDERKHSLHEVIRLSDTDVPMGEGGETETLTVKVASVPDTRLQVYFMDHEQYFQEGGLPSGQEMSSEALVRRALFFNRAAFETIRTLRWGPDLIHSFGWMGGLGPLLLSTVYAEEELLNGAKSIFTPNGTTGNVPSASVASALANGFDVSMNGKKSASFSDAGVQYADASIYPPASSSPEGAPKFGGDTKKRSEQLTALYDQMLNEVPA